MSSEGDTTGSVATKRQYTLVAALVPADRIEDVKKFAQEFFLGQDHIFEVKDTGMVTAKIWIGFASECDLALVPEFFRNLATHLGAEFHDQRFSSGRTKSAAIPPLVMPAQA